jgi:hypothetical protein
LDTSVVAIETGKLMTLSELYSLHEGKLSDKWESYLPIYERILTPHRGGQATLLEIGIQNGGSLELYAKFLGNYSVIVGCDINEKCRNLSYNGNTHVVVGDCKDDDIQSAITKICPIYDIIIDDGSHTSSDIITAFLKYFPMLRDGGVFILEDLHCSYWKAFEGGLFYGQSSMAFLKMLADTINAEHWGVGKKAEDLIAQEFSDYKALVPNSEIGKVFSVQFFNSVCAVTKAPTGETANLGKRIIAGREAIASQHHLAMKNGGTPVIDERDNVYSQFV